MRQANFTHPRPERRANPSGWPEGYFGRSAETSQVVCRSCYRIVHVDPKADVAVCPRCGVALDIDSGSEMDH